MDELNVHQFWGISPFIDLLAASAAAFPSKEQAPGQSVAFLQICPCDCRHTLATISSNTDTDFQARLPAPPSAPTAEAPTAAPTAPAAEATAAAAAQPDGPQHQHQPTQQTLQTQLNNPTQQPLQQLQLYVFENEPEVLARHMLLLALLFDGSLPVRQRAEMFLELHGNVMLRQKTADYLGAISKWLEESVSQLSLCASPAAAAPSTDTTAAKACPHPTPSSGSSSSSASEKQQQQQQQPAGLGVLAAFDLGLLRYQDRDALLETFQKYRHKASFNMCKAWDDRCRKWYGDRYDFRTNMVDWDYHMRLSPRGTPFMDPAHGSIVHFYHFRHWRLTGVAHELRDSSYSAPNTSLLSTAIGRTREFKDRQLRDVGRSVSAFSYWGDILNSPYHAFGTTADDAGLFSITNKQFSHTAVDVAEHNVLGFINRLRAGGQSGAAAAAAAAAVNRDAAGGCSAECVGSSSAAKEAHRANAARGPTSMAKLTAAGQQAQQQEDQRKGQQQQQQQQQEGATAEQEQDAQQQKQEWGNNKQQQQQQQQENELEQLAALEAALTAASIERLLASTKIHLLTGDLKRSLTSRPKFAGKFTAATVGHRHVHLLGPEHGLAAVLRPGAAVLVESGQNMVQLNGEQLGAFEERAVELAAAAGFVRHPVLGQRQQQQQRGEEEGNGQDSKQQQPGTTGREGEAAGEGGQGGGAGQNQREPGNGWQLPPGHFALGVVDS